MIFPHVVTLYNVERITDTSSFEETVSNNITILTGVFLEASKGTHVIKSGLESADAVTLHVPFTVRATDPETGLEKSFLPPIQFFRETDKSGYWTLSSDRNTFFIKGTVVVEGPMTEEYINYKYDGVYTVTKVDEKDFGRAHMRHWECGGV